MSAHDKPEASDSTGLVLRGKRHYHADRRVKGKPAGRRRIFAEPAAEQSQCERNLVVCKSNGQFLNTVHVDQIDKLLAQSDSFIWLDMQNPGEHDLKMLRQEFGFHPLAIEDATRRFERPKIDTYDNYYFLVFYALTFHEEQVQLAADALHLFIGKNYLVTIHQQPLPVVQRTIERWQRREDLFSNDVGALVHGLLDAIVDDYFPVMDQVAERVEDLEARMFAHLSQSVQQEIFDLKRILLGMRRVIAPERDVLNVLIRRDLPVFQTQAIVYLQDVYDHLMRVTDSLDTYREMLSSALDVYLSVQSNQLNQTMRVLTVTSIILMSAALIAGIYGMNFEYMPELHWRYGYFFALGLMVFISGGLMGVFRWLKML